MTKLNQFKRRCQTAQESLPESPYKNMLINLHNEMLAEIERTQRPSIVIDDNKIVETIGRLIGRGHVHKNAGDQTTNEKKKNAHYLAWNDLHSLADELASATSDPEYYKTDKAYKKAVGA